MKACGFKQAVDAASSTTSILKRVKNLLIHTKQHRAFLGKRVQEGIKGILIFKPNVEIDTFYMFIDFTYRDFRLQVNTVNTLRNTDAKNA